jgi:GntR family transcriptional regulator/MocR family aminotransferase
LIALSLLLLNPGDRVWLEDPCYLGARTALELACGQVVPVPLDDEGIRTEIGIKRAPDARLAYVTPSSQYPTGAMLSLARRIALLDWAARRDAFVIEDDYDGDFRYEGQPITPLYALDARARVLYVSTLSKPMFVALRLAFAIVPQEFVEALADIRTQLDAFTTPVLQMTMSMFMEEGHFSAHLRRMRGIYAAKRATLVDAIAPLRAKGWTWSTNPAGMHLLLRHANGKYVRATAAASGLDIALLSRYRTTRATSDGLLLRFAALTREQLREGTDALVVAAGVSACWNERQRG